MAEIKLRWASGETMTMDRLNKGTPASGKVMPNSEDAYVDQWVKLGEVKFTAQYQSASAWVMLSSSNAAGESTHSLIHAKFKQEAVLGQQPVVRLNVMNGNSSFQKSQVKAVGTARTTSTTCELWVSVHNHWEAVTYTPLMVEANQWTWFENMSWVASPPGVVDPDPSAITLSYSAKYAHAYTDILDVEPSNGTPTINMIVPGRAGIGKVYWNASSTNDYGLVVQVDGTTAMTVYSNGQVSTSKGIAVVTNNARIEKLVHYADSAVTGATAGWVRIALMTFPITYASAPHVAITLTGNAAAVGGKTQVINTTTTGFELWAEVATLNSTVYFSYLAVGPI